jgi:hypothetical protein
MTNLKTASRGRVVEIIERYGRCLELVPLDPNFHDISVGLYDKDGLSTVWTFSQRAGVEERVRKIRDQLVALGGMEPVEGTHNQVRFPCAQQHRRPTMFLVMQAVEKDPEYSVPEGKPSVKDRRSDLMLGFEATEQDGRWVYRVTAEGEVANKAQRLKAVTAGFVRYGEMEKLEDVVSFPCGFRHDPLAALVLPYARNVSGVEDMLEVAALRGQMTTGTLGFTPPT